MNGPLVPDHLVGDRIAGRFVIERAIGHGPLSHAFRATDELLQRRVTVKLFHPQHPDDVAVIDSQLELAKAVARLNHPNIVTVIDRGEHEGLPFVVLEYVRGENLDERLERWAPLAVSEVAGYGISIARALAYAHAQGVVHGNLRPGNVLVSEEREVKLVDFGGGSYLASLTGSDPYLAPERRVLDTPHAHLGPEEDIFALGVLLFVALTEEHPLPGISAADVQLLRPDASPRLASIIVRAMSDAPEDRPHSMHEFAAELASARTGSSARPVDLFATSLPVAPPIDTQSSDAHGDDDASQAFAGQHTVVTPGGSNQMRSDDHWDDDDMGTGSFDAQPVNREEHRAHVRNRQQHRRASRRARLVGWSMLVVPVLVLGLIGMMIAGERGQDSTSSTRGGKRLASGPEVNVRLVGAGSMDPEGDKFEHEDEAANVIDDRVGTAWQTEGYTNGLGKAGVGVWVHSARDVPATHLTLRTDLEGWAYSVYGSDQPSSTINAWTKVSDTANAETGKPTALNTHGKKYGYWLVWVTGLSVDIEDSNKMRARIQELHLLVPSDG